MWRLVLVVIVVEKVVLIVEGNISQKKILKNIEFFCGQSGVCVDPEADGSETCCQACSCAEFCDFEGNCCFKTEKQQSARPMYTECFYPTTKVHPSFSHQFTTYTMLDKCLPEVIGGRADPSCSQVKVAPWGVLFPVYAEDMMTTYFNSKCAECSTITYTTPWEAVLTCDKFGASTRIPFDIIAHFSTFNSNTTPDHCSVEFQPPPNLDPSSKMFFDSTKCESHDLITTCKESFYVPRNSPLSKQQIIDACERSRFESPYFVSGRYKNVFCHICNGEAFPLNNTCHIEQHIQNNGVGKFRAIMSPDVYNNFLHGIQAGSVSTKPEVVCQENIKVKGGNCKEVFCPSGQLFNTTGQCGYVSEEWLVDVYVLNLKLTPTVTLTRSDLAIVNITLPYMNTLFKSRLNDAWTVVELLVQVSNDQQRIQCYIVKLKLETTDRKAYPSKKVLEDARLTFSTYPVFATPLDRIMFKSEVLEYEASWVNSKSDELIPQWRHTLFSKDGVDPTVLKGHISSIQVLKLADYQLIGEDLLLTELYFCKQIELLENEVEVIANYSRILKSKINGKFYFDGEYVVLRKNGGVVYRVCLEDSGFVTQGYKASGLDSADKITGATGASSKIWNGIPFVSFIVICLLYWNATG